MCRQHSVDGIEEEVEEEVEMGGSTSDSSQTYDTMPQLPESVAPVVVTPHQPSLIEVKQAG